MSKASLLYKKIYLDEESWYGQIKLGKKVLNDIHNG